MDKVTNIRVFFTKKDRAKYISHLDMYRLFMRVIKKSGLPVWYTEGFNPHMYMTFPLPLSLGVESECECVDLRTTEFIPFAQIKERLMGQFPMGIEVLDVQKQQMDQKEIVFSDYDICLYLKDHPLCDAKERFMAFMEQEQIIVLKKTKKKVMKELDIKPMCECMDCDIIDDQLHLVMRCATGIERNLNPSLLISAFCSEEDLRYTNIRRLRVLNENIEDFC